MSKNGATRTQAQHGEQERGGALSGCFVTNLVDGRARTARVLSFGGAMGENAEAPATSAKRRATTWRREQAMFGAHASSGRVSTGAARGGDAARNAAAAGALTETSSARGGELKRPT